MSVTRRASSEVAKSASPDKQVPDMQRGFTSAEDELFLWACMCVSKITRKVLKLSETFLIFFFFFYSMSIFW